MRRAILSISLATLAASLVVGALGCEETYPPPEYPPPPDPSQPGAAAIEAQGADDPPVATDADGGAAAGSSGDSYADTDPAALSDFKATLDPHGSWVEDPTYGTVWVPSQAEVGPDFAPYVSAGHWEYGDDYVWVSDYDWGWAPFHYGRWVYIAGVGWSWIPGREYRGAWVTWRVGDEGYEYVGWAPMPPYWVWHGGAVVWLAAPPPVPYIFCHSRYVFAPVVASHVVVGGEVAVVAGRTHAYVAASPVVQGRAVLGPPPARIGIAATAVARVSASPTVVRAQQFAHPSTAVALGARRPVVAAPVVRRGVGAPVPQRGGVRAAPRIRSAPAPHVSVPRGGGGHHR